MHHNFGKMAQRLFCRLLYFLRMFICVSTFKCLRLSQFISEILLMNANKLLFIVRRILITKFVLTTDTCYSIITTFVTIRNGPKFRVIRAAISSFISVSQNLYYLPEGTATFVRTVCSKMVRTIYCSKCWRQCDVAWEITTSSVGSSGKDMPMEVNSRSADVQ